MNDFIWFLINDVVVLCGWEIGKAIRRRMKMGKTYKWSCPQCSFKVRTNMKETYEISVSSHVHNREKFDPKIEQERMI